MRHLISPARRSGPVQVTLVVLCLHLVWILAYFAVGHEIRDFIRIGPRFVESSNASSVIRIDPDYEYPQNRDPDFEGRGFDGQFSY